MVVSRDPLLTAGTRCVEEGDTRAAPLHLNLLEQALNVEDVLTSKLDAGSVTNS